jgi:hypothetical protein
MLRLEHPQQPLVVHVPDSDGPLVASKMHDMVVVVDMRDLTLVDSIVAVDANNVRRQFLEKY